MVSGEAGFVQKPCDCFIKELKLESVSYHASILGRSFLTSSQITSKSHVDIIPWLRMLRCLHKADGQMFVG
jgi:hypothetical protein